MVAIDGLAAVEGSGGIEQAIKAVAQECWQVLSMHGGRFSCMQALETKLLVPRKDVVRVLEWFGGIKQFPQAQQVAHILSRGVPVVVVVVVVSHIQRIGCQPEKTTLHGGQSRSWSAEQGKENKRKSLAAYPPPHPPHCSFGENK